MVPWLTFRRASEPATSQGTISESFDCVPTSKNLALGLHSCAHGLRQPVSSRACVPRSIVWTQ
jgi:hypothetical protein